MRALNIRLTFDRAMTYLMALAIGLVLLFPHYERFPS